MSRNPCLFFNKPNGCRKGSQCQFLHNGAGANVQRPSSPTPSSSSNAARGRSQSTSRRAPPGICNFYWTSGTCKREFACRFRHTQPSPAANTELRPQVIPLTSLEAIAPFLTKDGLARVAGTGTDVFFSADSSKDLSPTEAHNALKRYLFNDYRFKMTLDIYAFLKPLSSAHTSNSSWVCKILLDSRCVLSVHGILLV
jgi:hypothetical protein